MDIDTTKLFASLGPLLVASARNSQEATKVEQRQSIELTRVLTRSKTR